MMLVWLINQVRLKILSVLAMKNMCFLILKDVSKFKAPTIVCAGIAISEIIIKFAFYFNKVKNGNKNY